MTYNVFKFLHIVAVIVWIGGLVTVAVLNARFARREDHTAHAAMVRQSRFLGAFVIGPAAGIGLVAGIVMMVVGQLGAHFWIVWGFAVMALSLVLGATVLRRAGTRLGERLATTDHGNLDITALQRRLATLSAINILLLLSAVWAMIFRPTL
jgi:uncharacterized membrane protein